MPSVRLFCIVLRLLNALISALLCRGLYVSLLTRFSGCSPAPDFVLPDGAGKESLLYYCSPCDLAFSSSHLVHPHHRVETLVELVIAFSSNSVFSSGSPESGQRYWGLCLGVFPRADECTSSCLS